MKRQVRVMMNFIVEYDDDGVTLPDVSRTAELLEATARIVTPGASALLPRGSIKVGLTASSSREVRKAAKQGA